MNIHPFQKELEFENALCELLPNHGWSTEILSHSTEQDLINNWASIIYDMNRENERLGNYPLTSTEMQQIIDQVNLCGSPYKVNKFINGKYVSVKRDNPEDTLNYGKEVYLKIFDPAEISSGQSRYQIVRQPRFKASNPLAGDRRGDVLLLINGMPVIHVELNGADLCGHDPREDPLLCQPRHRRPLPERVPIPLGRLQQQRDL